MLLLADIQTFEELRGPIKGATAAFVGDGYNMRHSYIKGRFGAIRGTPTGQEDP